MRMKSCLDFILPLFLLWGITACSAPADKDMLEYEHSLAHADSLVRSGVADVPVPLVCFPACIANTPV